MGGVISSLEAEGSQGLRYALFLAVYYLAFPAVNIFALLSGYVGYGTRHRISSLLELVLATLLSGLSVSWVVVQSGLLPDSVDSGAIAGWWERVWHFSAWWYVSSYIVIYPLFPFIDRAISLLDNVSARKVCIWIATMLSVVPLFLDTDLGLTGYGYSSMWLLALYFIGACAGRFDWMRRINISGLIAMLLLSDVILSTGRGWYPSLPYDTEIPFSYLSPLVVLEALCLIGICERIPVSYGAARIVRSLSSASLGVYVLHQTPMFFYGWMKGAFSGFAAMRLLHMVLACIAATITIYFVCYVIDRVRALLFSFLRVRQVLSPLDGLGILVDAGKK